MAPVSGIPSNAWVTASGPGWEMPQRHLSVRIINFSCLGGWVVGWSGGREGGKCFLEFHPASTRSDLNPIVGRFSISPARRLRWLDISRKKILWRFSSKSLQFLYSSSFYFSFLFYIYTSIFFPLPPSLFLSFSLSLYFSSFFSVFIRLFRFIIIISLFIRSIFDTVGAAAWRHWSLPRPGGGASGPYKNTSK